MFVVNRQEDVRPLISFNNYLFKIPCETHILLIVPSLTALDKPNGVFL